MNEQLSNVEESSDEEDEDHDMKDAIISKVCMHICISIACVLLQCI